MSLYAYVFKSVYTYIYTCVHAHLHAMHFYMHTYIRPGGPCPSWGRPLLICSSLFTDAFALCPLCSGVRLWVSGSPARLGPMVVGSLPPLRTLLLAVFLFGFLSVVSCRDSGDPVRLASCTVRVASAPALATYALPVHTLGSIVAHSPTLSLCSFSCHPGDHCVPCAFAHQSAGMCSLCWAGK